MTELFSAMSISAAGMKAQGTRIRVISENLANSGTTATTPGGDPYTRQTVTFKNTMDRKRGFDLVDVSKIGKDDKKPFPTKYMPDSPAADANGYVKMPNVDPLVELMDMKEAQRTYEANLGMIDQSRSMILSTIDILRR
jgi:flagellar basal-body rod protein FlgC